MTVKERIHAIKLINESEKYPDFMSELGVKVELKDTKKTDCNECENSISGRRNMGSNRISAG